MNAKLFLLFPLLVAPMAFAEDAHFQTETANPAKNWNLDPAYWDRFLQERKEHPPIQLGKSDFVLNGPLIEAFRPGRKNADLSLGQRILHLPIIRSFVPQPMPMPPASGGKYLAWKTPSSEAWLNAAYRPGILKGPISY